MPNYYTNFTTSTQGSPVSGWTSRGAGGILEFNYWPSPATNSLNNAEAWLRSIYTDVYGSITGFSMDSASADVSSANCDVLISARFPGNISEQNCGIFARGTGGLTNAYVALMTAGGFLRLGRVNSGVYNDLGTYQLAVSPRVNNSVHYKLRLRCQGTTISLTAWPRNASEPSAQISVTDGSITAQGTIGVVGINGGTQNNKVAMAVEAFAAFVGTSAATFTDTLPADPAAMRDIAAKTLSVYNYPSAGIENISDHTLLPVARQTDNGVEAYQLRTLAVGRGRIDKRNQLAWTYTLDGHDYYILRLGDDQTLVYDLSTGAWADWGETSIGLDGQIDYDDRWRLATGLNWRGLGPLANSLGSDIVVGDDTFGTLHVLDPLYEVDYQPSIEGTRPFQRRAQGMLTMAGRDSIPIWGVQLTGSSGEQFDGTLNTVELQSSDDLGHNYYSHGVTTVAKGDYTIRTDWNSLGSTANPGRLFKIIDNGALARIDSLDTYDAKS